MDQVGGQRLWFLSFCSGCVSRVSTKLGMWNGDDHGGQVRNGDNMGARVLGFLGFPWGLETWELNSISFSVQSNKGNESQCQARSHIMGHWAMPPRWPNFTNLNYILNIVIFFPEILVTLLGHLKCMFVLWLNAPHKFGPLPMLDWSILLRAFNVPSQNVFLVFKIYHIRIAWRNSNCSPWSTAALYLIWHFVTKLFMAPLQFFSPIFSLSQIIRIYEVTHFEFLSQ